MAFFRKEKDYKTLAQRHFEDMDAQERGVERLIKQGIPAEEIGQAIIIYHEESLERDMQIQLEQIQRNYKQDGRGTGFIRKGYLPHIDIVGNHVSFGCAKRAEPVPEKEPKRSLSKKLKGFLKLFEPSPYMIRP